MIRELGSKNSLERELVVSIHFRGGSVTIRSREGVSGFSLDAAELQVMKLLCRYRIERLSNTFPLFFFFFFFFFLLFFICI
jgi:hypothetical protein